MPWVTQPVSARAENQHPGPWHRGNLHARGCLGNVAAARAPQAAEGKQDPGEAKRALTEEGQEQRGAERGLAACV